MSMDTLTGHTHTPAGEFKQKCLAILDEVAAGASYIITKRGKPVARLVPLEAPAETERGILTELRALAVKPGRVRLPAAELLMPSSSFAAWSDADVLDSLPGVELAASAQAFRHKPGGMRRARRALK
jgi:prevent-host-death family protein